MKQHSRFTRKTTALLSAAALLAAVLPLCQTASAGPDGRSVMDKVALTRKLDGSEAQLKMKIVDEGGKARERELSMATKLFDGGKTEKRIYRFTAPADLKGMGVLVFDYAEKSDEMWLMTAAQSEPTRIAGGKQSKAFMGSEFSFGDLAVPSLDDFSYKLSDKEEKIDGEACFVVEVLPKNAEVAGNEGYSKKVYWVSKDKFVIRQGDFYGPDGKLLKELKARDVVLLDKEKKRYRAKVMEMTNKVNGRKSTFETLKVAFSPAVNDDFFTQAYLSRK